MIYWKHLDNIYMMIWMYTYFIIITWSFYVLVSSQRDIKRNLMEHIQQIDEDYNQQKEYLVPKVEQSKFSIPQWIINQNEQTKQHNHQYQNMVQQSFSFLMKYKDKNIFRWNPTKNKQLCMEIFIKFVNKEGQFDFSYGEKSQFLEVFSKRKQRDTYYYVDNVYFHKRIILNFDTDYRIIQFLNLYKHTIVVDVRLQWAGTVIKEGIKDKDLQEQRDQSNLILQNVKTIKQHNEKLFRMQRDIKQQRRKHQRKYTIMTGIQLVFIVMSSVIQVICTRKLLENKQIV